MLESVECNFVINSKPIIQTWIRNYFKPHNISVSMMRGVQKVHDPNFDGAEIQVLEYYNIRTSIKKEK